jgi:hypothetical protein
VGCARSASSGYERTWGPAARRVQNYFQVDIIFSSARLARARCWRESKAPVMILLFGGLEHDNSTKRSSYCLSGLLDQLSGIGEQRQHCGHWYGLAGSTGLQLLLQWRLFHHRSRPVAIPEFTRRSHLDRYLRCTDCLQFFLSDWKFSYVLYLLYGLLRRLVGGQNGRLFGFLVDV